MNKREKLERRRRLREAKARGPKPNYTGPNRGKNPPRDVLAFIELRMRMAEAQPDPIELARELGYDERGIWRLKSKHPDDLLRYLQSVERERRDTDRYLPPQNGRSHPEQYVESHIGAIDELPVVPKHYEKELPLQNARRMYNAMVEAEASIKHALDQCGESVFAGEIRRSYAQAKRARERAERQLEVVEREKAA